MDIVIKVDKLTKRYGDLTAVSSISFSIKKGEVFGLLGPNGAGKTTTVEMIEGLRKPDSGSIEVCGIDAQKNPENIKELIGAQLQSTTIYDQIRVKEVIDLFGSYYKKSIPTNEILEEVSLTDKKNAFYRTLSGGQKQRVAMGLALVNDPEVLFLDEPTTGLDPQARRNVWAVITSLRKRGKTIILTTHYMEEAEQLCQRVGIIDHGKIIALDTPANLIIKSELESAIEFGCLPEGAEKIKQEFKKAGKISDLGDNKYILNTRESSKTLTELTRFSDDNNINLENISVRKATLEDVFLLLTGRSLRE
jgi:ABC-2 type transport system ATP-binding protein